MGGGLGDAAVTARRVAVAVAGQVPSAVGEPGRFVAAGVPLTVGLVSAFVDQTLAAVTAKASELAAVVGQERQEALVAVVGQERQAVLRAVSSFRNHQNTRRAAWAEVVVDFVDGVNRGAGGEVRAVWAVLRDWLPVDSADDGVPGVEADVAVITAGGALISQQEGAAARRLLGKYRLGQVGRDAAGKNITRWVGPGRPPGQGWWGGRELEGVFPSWVALSALPTSGKADPGLLTVARQALGRIVVGALWRSVEAQAAQGGVAADVGSGDVAGMARRVAVAVAGQVPSAVGEPGQLVVAGVPLMAGLASAFVDQTLVAVTASARELAAVVGQERQEALAAVVGQEHQKALQAVSVLRRHQNTQRTVRAEWTKAVMDFVDGVSRSAEGGEVRAVWAVLRDWLSVDSAGDGVPAASGAGADMVVISAGGALISQREGDAARRILGKYRLGRVGRHAAGMSIARWVGPGRPAGRGWQGGRELEGVFASWVALSALPTSGKADPGQLAAVQSLGRIVVGALWRSVEAAEADEAARGGVAVGGGLGDAAVTARRVAVAVAGQVPSADGEPGQLVAAGIPLTVGLVSAFVDQTLAAVTAKASELAAMVGQERQEALAAMVGQERQEALQAVSSLRNHQNPQRMARAAWAETAVGFVDGVNRRAGGGEAGAVWAVLRDWLPVGAADDGGPAAPAVLAASGVEADAAVITADVAVITAGGALISQREGDEARRILEEFRLGIAGRGAARANVMFWVGPGRPPQRGWQGRRELEGVFPSWVALSALPTRSGKADPGPLAVARQALGRIVVGALWRSVEAAEADEAARGGMAVDVGSGDVAGTARRVAAAVAGQVPSAAGEPGQFVVGGVPLMAGLASAFVDQAVAAVTVRASELAAVVGQERQEALAAVVGQERQEALKAVLALRHHQNMQRTVRAAWAEAVVDFVDGVNRGAGGEVRAVWAVLRDWLPVDSPGLMIQTRLEDRAGGDGRGAGVSAESGVLGGQEWVSPESWASGASGASAGASAGGVGAGRGEAVGGQRLVDLAAGDGEGRGGSWWSVMREALGETGSESELEAALLEVEGRDGSPSWSGVEGQFVDDGVPGVPAAPGTEVVPGAEVDAGVITAGGALISQLEGDEARRILSSFRLGDAGRDAAGMRITRWVGPGPGRPPEQGWRGGELEGAFASWVALSALPTRFGKADLRPVMVARRALGRTVVGALWRSVETGEAAVAARGGVAVGGGSVDGVGMARRVAAAVAEQVPSVAGEPGRLVEAGVPLMAGLASAFVDQTLAAVTARARELAAVVGQEHQEALAAVVGQEHQAALQAVSSLRNYQARQRTVRASWVEAVVGFVDGVNRGAGGEVWAVWAVLRDWLPVDSADGGGPAAPAVLAASGAEADVAVITAGGVLISQQEGDEAKRILKDYRLGQAGYGVARTSITKGVGPGRPSQRGWQGRRELEGVFPSWVALSALPTRSGKADPGPMEVARRALGRIVVGALWRSVEAAEADEAARGGMAVDVGPGDVAGTARRVAAAVATQVPSAGGDRGGSWWRVFR